MQLGRCFVSYSTHARTRTHTVRKRRLALEIEIELGWKIGEGRRIYDCSVLFEKEIDMWACVRECTTQVVCTKEGD